MGDRRDKELLSRDVDDLLLQARGLVLVRHVLAERGISRPELDAHTDELERVRARLAAAVRGRAGQLGNAA
jgi:hypothetical protein